MTMKKPDQRTQKPSGFHARYSGWGPILSMMKRGARPDPETLAEKLRTVEVAGLSESIRLLIAGYLDGSIKRKGGRKQQNSFSDMALNVAVEYRYQVNLAEVKPPKGVSKANAALAKTAEDFGKSPKATQWVIDRIYSGRLFRKK